MDTMKADRGETRKVSPLTRLVLVVAAITVAALGIAALVGLATNGFRWGQVGGPGTIVDERKSVSLDGVTSLVIVGVSEDIVLGDASSASGGASLDAWLHGNAGGSPSELPRLTAERAGSVVTVKVERIPRVVLSFNWTDVKLDVGLPAGYAGDLSVHSTSGGITLARHTYRALAVSSTSGSLKLDTVSASSLVMHTTSGDLAASAVSAGTADLSSTSGGIRVTSLAGANAAKMHTTSGDVDVTFAAVPARLDASSTSGSVRIRLPADAAFKLDARSTSGRVTCAFPITLQQDAPEGGRHALSGNVGGSAAGTATVSVHTTSGGIAIQ
jgi:hypothetical protein